MARKENIRGEVRSGRACGGAAITRPLPDTTQLPADLGAAFERLTKDAVGDFGPTPLARLLASHITLFGELRRRGASWAQIGGLLAAHGVGGKSPIAADVLRATYARAAKGIDAAERKRTGRNAAKHNETDRNAAMRAETRRNATTRNRTARRVRRSPVAPL